MFEPRFERTDLLIELIARIAVARDRSLRAPIVPRWEAELRREALTRSGGTISWISGSKPQNAVQAQRLVGAAQQVVVVSAFRGEMHVAMVS